MAELDTINHARRNLFRGKVDTSADNAPLRGPFAIMETLFVHQCTQCNDCIEACPKNVLFKGSGGFPEISFKEG
jgi:ferredoxin-type protein NapF